MNLPLTIAVRYLFPRRKSKSKFADVIWDILKVTLAIGFLGLLGELIIYLLFHRHSNYKKKYYNIVNIISRVTITGLLFGAGGLILVLSVFNGFQGLVVSLYNSFNPDLVIAVREGKSFAPDSLQLATLSQMKGIRAVSEVIEENALLTYGDQQFIATIKGVDAGYGSRSGIDTMLYDGKFLPSDSTVSTAVLGYGVALALEVNIADPLGAISIYIPNSQNASSILPAPDFQRGQVSPRGIFSIQSEFDMKYVFIPLELARELTGYDKRVSYIEAALLPSANANEIKKQIQEFFGTDFKVLNRLQQNEALYKVMKTEKWAVYAVLTFILIVAAFNIVGSLSMLVIEKKKDISILRALGAGSGYIQRIFLWEGIMISIIGCLSGFLLAILLIYIQHQWEPIKIPGGTFVIDAFPVRLKMADLILVFITVMFIGLAASWFPSWRAARSEIHFNQE